MSFETRASSSACFDLIYCNPTFSFTSICLERVTFQEGPASPL